MEKNKLDTFFRNALKTSAVEPGEGTWGRLEERLGKKRSAVAWRYAGMAAAVLLLAIAWFGYYHGVLQRSGESVAASSTHDRAVERRAEVVEQATQESSSSGMTAREMVVPEPVKPVAARALPEAPAAAPERITSVTSGAGVELAGLQENLPQEGTSLPTADVQGAAEADPAPSHEDIVQEDSPEEQLAWSPDDRLPIRIVYKKGPPPSRQEEVRDGVFARGVRKLEDLAGDIGNMKLSEETKARIRNTREEVLAFNIEKIFRKEDKSTEQ